MVNHMKYKKMEHFFFLVNQAYQEGKKGTFFLPKFGLKGFCQAPRDEVGTSGIRFFVKPPVFF
ncbi:MAG: hypothetical protein CM15mP117_12880 [Alphaproteobacteria bacterium]|nr:MAG: hypothetical protein CM15mP117_12880 [Alphaproteobacteria bacterium]